MSECKPRVLDSPEASMAEVAWVAREARALMEARRPSATCCSCREDQVDPEREAQFTARKRALLAYVEQRP